MSRMMGIKRLPSVTSEDHQKPISERSFHCSLHLAFSCGHVGSVGLKAGGGRNTLGEGLGQGIIGCIGLGRRTVRSSAASGVAERKGEPRLPLPSLRNAALGLLLLVAALPSRRYV